MSKEAEVAETKVNDEEAEDAVFDQLLDTVGSHGRFQKRFNYIFNFGFTIFTSMVYMNILLVRNDPDHWCHVPGRNETNFTLDEWKQITLPREIDNRGISAISQCSMYDISGINGSSLLDYGNSTNWNFTNLEKTECQYGYDYDRTWYSETLTSQENWVCGKKILATNSLTFARMGEVIGTFVFGSLGDSLGRRKVLYLSLYVMIAGRLLSVIFTTNFVLHSIACVIGGLSSMVTFTTPLIILMETSASENRASSAVMQNYGWVVGMIIMPLIFWVVRDWIWFTLITTIPCLFFLVFHKYIIESPRWLASKDKMDKAAKQLNKIAKINKIKPDVELTGDYLRERLPKRIEEKSFGFLSLFSSIRLALTTINLSICWSVAFVLYSTLVLYIKDMDGNPFLNFVFQSAAEFPSFLIGRYLSDKIGRRFTNLTTFTLCGLCCLPEIYLVTQPGLSDMNMNMTILTKFFANITFFAINLQAMEVFPTCLRQTGMSTVAVVSSIFGTLGPMIVYLGQVVDARLPFIIMAALSFLGGLCGIFLPETLHQKLPENLAEAQVYGKDQKFWKLPKKPKDINENVAEYKELKMKTENIKNNGDLEKLNEKEFTP